MIYVLLDGLRRRPEVLGAFLKYWRLLPNLYHNLHQSAKLRSTFKGKYLNKEFICTGLSIYLLNYEISFPN